MPPSLSLPETGVGTSLLFLAFAALIAVVVGAFLVRRSRLRGIGALALAGLGLSLFTVPLAGPAAVAAPVDPAVASISGRVFLDENANGVQDDDAPAPDSARVTLRDGAGADVATVVTDADGRYRFEDLTGGDYTVVFPAELAGGALTEPDQADTTQDSDPDPSTGITKTVDLSPCEEVTGIDAGYLPAPVEPGVGAIAGRAFEDANGNGLQEEDDRPIAGVAVELRDSDGAVAASTTTDDDGRYLFEDLTPGTYTVAFATPSTYTPAPIDQGDDDTLDSDVDPRTGATMPIDVIAEGRIDHVDAGFVRLSGIRGGAFIDADQNGMRGDGLILAGVEVSLRDADGGVVESQVTDADGSYFFRGLHPGTYTVSFTTPAGYEIAAPDQGLEEADSDVDPATGATAPIVLTPGQLADFVDAGYVSQAGTISGMTFVDGDGDGIRDEEMVLPAVAVSLLDGAGNVLETTTSDASGRYVFADLQPGDYVVVFDTPSGYSATVQNAGGDDSIDSDADPGSGRSAALELDVRGAITIDAGYLIDLGPVAISGRAWSDASADGVGTDEVPLPGVTVTLRDEAGGVVDSTQTDTFGRYAFADLSAGTYSVAFPTAVGGMALTTQGPDSDPEQHTGITGNLVLADGEVRRDVDAGYISGAIRGATFLDKNRGGTKDAGEGLSGVPVSLRDSAGAEIATTVTDEDGGYSFLGLATGDYAVGFPTSHLGYELVLANQGGDASADSDPDPDTGITPLVSVTTGAIAENVDAGYLDPRTGVITGIAFYDENSDGQFNGDDSAYGGQPLYLYDDQGRELIFSATDSTGRYTFSGLEAGRYVVVFELLAYPPLPGSLNWYLTQPNVGDDATDSDADVYSGASPVIDLPAGGVEETVWVGYAESPWAGPG